MGHYETALICEGGHTINDSAGRHPALYAKFCKQCGKAAVGACRHCSQAIRGDYYVPGVAVLGRKYQPPSYCHNCGAAYPWTESRLKAAADLIDLADNVSDADKKALVESVPDLLRDTPQSPVAATRWKRFLNGPGKQMGDVVKQVFVEVASEAVKKTMFGI